MKAAASALAGLCAFEDGGQWHFVNVDTMEALDPSLVHIAYGNIDDWESVEASDREEFLRASAERYRFARLLTNIETCLVGVSSSLQKELLHEAEDILKSTNAASKLTAMLLRAPLSSVSRLQGMASESLSEGLAAIGSLLNLVSELQPLLISLTDHWLLLSDDLFSAIPGGRQHMWRTATSAGVVLDTLHAESSAAVEKAWGRLAFDLPTPAERAAVPRLSRAIVSAMFPGHAEPRGSARLARDRDHLLPQRHSRHLVERREDAQTKLDRAIRQIEVIASAVSEGQDSKARRFLRELVDAELAFAGGDEYAVKSLCNIAQQCAEMFRTDFEYECLHNATAILPGDRWTLVQLADHYKRVGKFEDAIAILGDHERFGGERIAKSCLADVYVQMGQFDAAIKIYDQLLEVEQDEAVRQAKADTLRRWGHFEESLELYSLMIRDGMASHRVYSGQAEIAKRQGRLVEACELYQRLLACQNLDEQSSIIYRLAIANVLLRMGEFGQAYSRIDEVVQRRPFLRQARTFRTAVAGLLGKTDEVIRDLPRLGQTKAFREWVDQYVRGLLLLTLDRNADARAALLCKVENRLLDSEANGVLNLAAAVCFLRDKAGIPQALERLNAVPEMKDAFADAIRTALEYHVAVALRHKSDVIRLEKQLCLVEDDDFKAIVLALRRRDFSRARRLEVRALLRLTG